MNEIIDFGGGVTGYWLAWRPDRDIPSNAALYAGIADIDKCSLVLNHKTPQGEDHQGCITIDTPETQKVFSAYPKWQVGSWEPLTLTPSVLCSCGWHGFITAGRWVSC